MSAFGYEKGDTEHNLHAQGVARLLSTSTAMVTKRLKLYLNAYCPGVHVTCKALTNKGVHTFTGMLGYVQKCEFIYVRMGSALSCISPAPNATKSSTHEAAPSVPAAADPEAKSELPSNASNAAVKPVAIKDAQATAIGAENAAAQMQPTGTPPATKSDASPHAGATTTARDLPTAVESVFNIEGGGKLTDFAGVKSTGTEPALFAHAPIVMTSLPLSTCPADGTGGSPVGTSNTVGFVNASNVTSAVPVPTQTQLDPHKKPPTPAADAGGASFSSTADSPGLGTSPFPTQTQLDPHKKPPAPSADAGGASFSATVAGAGTSPFPTQTQLDPHKKPPTPAADAGGASFSATVAGAGAGCSRAKAGPSFGAIDLDTVVSTTSTSVQQSGTFADTANVQEEGKVHAAASPKGSGHAQGPSKASSMFPFFSARRIRKRGIPLPSITQIFGNMSSVFASFGAITVADTKPPSFKAEPESSHMAGARVVGPREALNILDDLDLASGAYKTSAKAMCAATRLKLQNIKFWSSNGSFIRPAMYIAVCHIKNELIVGVRGTKAFREC
eukprot:gene2050-18228_t